MHVEEKQLVDFLTGAGMVSRSQMDEIYRSALARSTPLSHVIVESGVLDEDELRRASAGALGIPFVRLSQDDIDTAALEALPEAFSRKHQAIAFAIDDDTLEVALLDVADIPKLEHFSNQLRRRILPRLTDRESVKRGLFMYQKKLKDQFGDEISRGAQAINEPLGETEQDLHDAAERLSVVQVVDVLVSHALHQHATDIHFEPRDSGLLVQYRISGGLYDAMILPSYAAESIRLRLKMLAGLNLDEKMPQEGRFKVVVNNTAYVARVVSMPTVAGEKIIIHIAQEGGGRKGFTLETLGFHGEGLECMHDVLAQKSGIVLVCGGEDSGKTTLLYTLIDMLGGRGRSIATLEDEIECRVPHATQMRIDEVKGVTPVSGLRAILRHDHDAVMVDIADGDTALLAVQAANRGKLVLASIDAPSASEGIVAMLGLGVPPLLLAATLRAAIGTQLVHRLCKHSEGYLPSRPELAQLETVADFTHAFSALKQENAIDQDAAWKEMSFYRPYACADCNNGYRGFLGVQEVMPISMVIKELILQNAPAENLQNQAREEGMLILAEDAIFKAVQGKMPGGELGNFI